MTGATGNIYAGLHEFADMMAVLHFLRPDDLFFDIGANVGSYTVLASGVCRARTWAFEPDPVTMAALRKNVVANRLDRLVTEFELALGSASEQVRFTVGADTTNRVAQQFDRNVQVVRQGQLDHLAEAADPVMMKIDVEGYEENVLRGARGLLAKPSLKVLELETVTPACEAILQDNDFRRAFYDPFTRRLGREPVGVPAANALFVRDREFVQSRLSSARAIKVLEKRV